MDGDRRQSKRHVVITEVHYEGAGLNADTRISDINVAGVFIDALSPPPVGAILTLRFTLPDGHRVVAEGRVVHCQPGIGMGVAFTSLMPQDAQHIQGYLSA